MTDYDMTVDAAKAIQPTEALVVIAAQEAVLVEDAAGTYVDIARAIAQHAPFFEELKRRDATGLTRTPRCSTRRSTRNSRAEGSPEPHPTKAPAPAGTNRGP